MSRDPLHAPVTETEAEWAARLRESIDGYIDLGMGVVDVRLGGSGGAREEAAERQELAALLLYGQPFGFTREDVNRLREAAEMFYLAALDRWGPNELPAAPMARDQVHAIINKLDALLPPPVN